MNSFFPIFWLVILVLSLLTRAAGGRGKKSSGAAAKSAPAPKKAQTRGPELPLRRRAKDDDCDYGDVNHQYSHESERRIRQLDGYLKAGLIDKKEYAQMLARYQKAERDFERY